MKRKQIRNSILLVITALIWGIAFVAQSEGGDAVGPFTFNGIRSFVGSAVLLPVIALLDKLKLTSRKPKTKEDRRLLWTGGICCGVVLFLASSFQQMGIYMGTAAGKAGFLTACYILLVPVLGIFLKKKCGFKVWIGIGLTLVGLYLLCMSGSMRFQLSDLLLLICALLFAVQILAVDHFSPLVDGVRMSCIQFLVCGLLSVIPMLCTETFGAGGAAAWLANLSTPAAWIAILYAGVFSCGVGYTLQIVGQDGLNPTVASLIMSLESVFSVIAGWLILDQRLGLRELLGCVLIFAAIILAQLPDRKRTEGERP